MSASSATIARLSQGAVGLRLRYIVAAVESPVRAAMQDRVPVLLSQEPQNSAMCVLKNRKAFRVSGSS